MKKIATIVFIIGLITYLKYNLEGILKYMPSCIFYDRWKIYCPACGNTRAVRYLLNGDILSSIRCNPIIFTLAVILLFYILEKFINKKLLPRNIVFWIVVILLFVIYYVVRNFVPILYPII